MKKIKLLPSVLMLVLCVAVLAIGVYAAAPVSHSIQGSISVSAAGARVKIGVYLDNLDGDDTLISNEIDTRQSDQLNIIANSLTFNCSSATTASEVDAINVYLKIENKSSIDLGAYFPVGEGTTAATAADIASVKHLDGTSTSGTISDVVKCQFGPYTQVASNATAYLKLDLSLAKLSHFEAVTVGLNLTLNLENYNANLAEVAGVNVYTNNQNVALTPATTYGQTAGAALTATKTDRYSASALTLDQGTYPEAWGTNVKKHETTKVSFTITNNGDSAVSADVVLNNTSYRASELKVVTLGNSYIPADGTGEVSVQFTVLDSAKASLTDFTLDDICVDIDIYEATEDTQAQADIQSRIAYTETAVGNNWHYYIEYGVNPYNDNAPLRWFIWAYDNEGTLTTIGNVNPTTTEGTYYFISEYVLDTTASNYGISFQNMYEGNNYYNIYAEYASDYAGSNYRNYMNGLTVKRAATYNSAYEASGDAINFYESFALTNDAIFAQISTDHVGTDKFWALSYSEGDVIGWGGNAKAYKLSDNNTSSSWWLRSPCGNYYEYYSNSGSCRELRVGDSGAGSRPAFKIQI